MTEKSERGLVATRTAVKIACWRALQKGGMTFSTNVTSGIEIGSAPDLTVKLAASEPS